MNLKNRYWHDRDKHQLWIAYQLKLPLKVMARYFGRSPTSVNKALNRFQIRPLGQQQRGVKKGSTQGACISLQHFSNLMEDCFSKNLDKINTAYPVSLNSYEGFNKEKNLNFNRFPSWQRHQKPKSLKIITEEIDDKTIMNARVDSPLASRKLKMIDPEADEIKKVLARTRLWISLECLLEKLKHYNVQVEPSHACNSQGHPLEFTVKGVVMSPAQLLIAANKIFHAHGEETVYVEGITL